MNKYILRAGILRVSMIILIIAFSIFLFACGSVTDNPNYIEVTQLKIQSANIRVAAEGEASTKQIEVEILPANATNRALTYSFPSEFTKYITISNDGVIQAKATPPENTTIPVTIKSTSNPKASLIVNVIVEEVSVKRLYFDTEKVELLYNGEGHQINITYYPAHASDGRSVTYTSLDKNIADVSDSGFIRPINAGQTSIKCVSKPRNSDVVEAYLLVVVKYVKAQYLLEVSDGAKFNRVIGDDTPIDFTIIITGEHTDPSPNIQWFVDTQREPEYSNKIQYSHVPKATTQLSYRIRVEILAYGETEPVRLESDIVSIYRPFVGIDLVYNNLSSTYDSFFYGQEHTFSILNASANIAEYRWFLKRTNGTTFETQVATTFPQDRNLTRILNLEGDYTLTVKGYSKDNTLVNAQVNQYQFSTTRLINGDTLIINPVSKSSGIIPESYHWYYKQYDKDGNVINDTLTLIADTASTETFIHKFNESGYYKLFVSATLNALPATIDDKIYYYESEIIHIADTNDDVTSFNSNYLLNTVENIHDFGYKNVKTIANARVEGIINGEEQFIMFIFDNNSQLNNYILEITTNENDINFFDSSNAQSSGLIFGSNYILMPTSLFNYQSKFTYRIKTKNSLFSDNYYYGSYNESGNEDTTHIYNYSDRLYPYFNAISYNNAKAVKSSVNTNLMKKPVTNLYIYNFEDLIDLINFITIFNPEKCDAFNVEHKIIESKNYIFYTAKIYLNNISFEDNLELDSLINTFTKNEIFYDETNTPKDTNDLTEKELLDFNARKLLLTALNLIYNPNCYDLRNVSRTGNEITFSLGIYDYFASTAVASGNRDTTNKYEYELTDEVYSHSSDDLTYILSKGFCPLPQSEILARLFNKAKEIGDSIIDNPNDKEAIISNIAEYLVLNVEKDDESKYSSNDFFTNYYEQLGYHAEGPINEGKANSLGFAQAFSLIAGIYGINSKIVKVINQDTVKYINVVYLNDKQFYVDVYDSQEIDDDVILFDTQYILATLDELITLLGVNTKVFG